MKNKNIYIFFLICFIIWLFLYRNIFYNNSKISKNINLISSFNKKIFCIWDSLTIWRWVEISNSYPVQLQNKILANWYKYKVINAWKSWDTTLSIYNNIDWYIADGKSWDIILLQLGENDSVQMMPSSDIATNIERIIDYLKKKWFVIVLFGMRLPESYWIEYSNKFKQMYYDIAKKYGKDIYFYEYFLEWVSAKEEYNLDDKIHPNKKGYDIISQKILDFLVEKKIISYF